MNYEPDRIAHESRRDLHEYFSPLFTPPPADNVNHPAHYTQGGIECIDALAAATVGKTGIAAVCVANAIKYLWRYEDKNGIEDVEKARWYVDKLIQVLRDENKGK